MRFVPIDQLEPGMRLGRKIINESRTCMLARGMELKDMHILRLKSHGYTGAYISDKFSAEVEYVEAVSEETFDMGVKAVAENNVGDLLQIAGRIVDEIARLETVSMDLLDLRSFDDYTYHHSVNVAVYATAVGSKMELSDEELQDLTVAALCHDLGKSRISPEIINKKERLTDEEYEEIKRHPQYGFEMLQSHAEIKSVVRQAVIFHHENENGSGYPYGKSGSDIPLFARIIHAVDVYDALTSKRSYKEPYSSADALAYMDGGKGILFDPSVVEAMEKVIPAYLPGIDVLLSNGERALVLSQGSHSLRPVVKIYASGQTVNLSTDPAFESVVIVASGMAGEGGQVQKLNEDRGKAPESKEMRQILVVDDSAISRAQTKNILGKEYMVIALENAVACAHYIAVKGCPDLLIMDIDMPVVSGVAAVENLRNKGYKDLKVMFLTGVSDRETVLRCRKVGAIDYILKPANPVYLLERVKVAFKESRDVY